MPVGIDDEEPPAFSFRPGDVVLVAVDTEPERAPQELTVDAQGRIHVAGAGQVRVGGLTVARAQALIAATVQKMDRLAQVQLQVMDTPGQRATVLGAVTTQGSVAVAPGMRVAQLISDSGGELSSEPTDTDDAVSMADLDGAVLTRNGSAMPISLARAMEGDPRHNIYVHAGDHLFVPPRERGSVTVFGQVGTPGMFAHRPGLRLTEALARAGGINPGGDKTDIRLLRGPVDKLQVYRADLTQVVDGEGPDVGLRAGDVLFVTDDPVEDVGEVLGLLAPFAALTSGLVLTLVLLQTAP